MKTIVASILGVLSLLAGAFFYGKKSGRNKEQARRNKEQLNEIQKANTVSFNAGNRSTDDRKQRMHERNLKK